MGSAKIQCSLWILWKKSIDGTNEFIEVDKVFHSNMTSVFQGTIVNESLDTMFAQMKTHIENPALPKSGFSIGRIQHLDVDFHKLKLRWGSSYIETPKWIATKKAIINPNNNDQECLRWALIAVLHYEDIAKDPQRISKLRPYVDRYKWQGIEFPTSIKDIIKFKRNNPVIAVNVLYATGRSFNILRRSIFNEGEKQVNLLLLTDNKKNHYTTIKNISRLLGSKISKNHGKMHFCMSCLQGFQTIESRDNHYSYCKDNEAVKITMPSDKKKCLYYQDGQQQFKVSFAIYADFESLLIPMKENARDTKTKTLNKHEPCGWATYSTFAYGEVPDPLYECSGEGCVQLFIQHLEDEVKRLYSLFSQKPMTELTEEQKYSYDAAETCHICMKPFNDDQKNRKIPNHVPVIFHNLSGYDAHLFIRELGEKYDTQDIGCIAENTEKYISFNVKITVPIAGIGYGDGEFYKKIEIRFIDSCRFMASSLEKLASNIVGTNTDGMKCQRCADTCLEFLNINDEYVASFWCSNCESNTTKQLDKERVKSNTPAMSYYFSDDELFRLMLRKGIYPYEYMDS
ncbi:uncharacterized protein LOC130648455 [Hydractinia symbiolongicarpus]|uniref:uncharacterized protein LOC130648455 n=1 Tax=Hydractinia symbiolongicarpus TaxID=13093 RepID=UPI0025515307|nr:uncharacterized protein LOC130648455 [Hydractinia symbiolongicarpus]